MNLIGSYMNGNYKVSIFDDGTKIRENNLDFFEPTTVESMDIKITNKCDKGCLMCHEDSKPDGIHGDILSPCFIDKLHPYTELAIGGGNPLEHPDLMEFLLKCKDKKLIPSMTVNQDHFMKNISFIKKLCDQNLIYGLGISLTNPTDKVIEEISRFPNAVIHLIAGLFDADDVKRLAYRNLKILILGYKKVRRGIDLYNSNMDIIEKRINWLKDTIKTFVKFNFFSCISFDNLALNQLDIKNTLNMSDEDWNKFYMGDDGQEEMTSSSMYVDMVKREFARNSCSMERYPIMDTVEEMYNFLKGDKISEDVVT